MQLSSNLLGSYGFFSTFPRKNWARENWEFPENIKSWMHFVRHPNPGTERGSFFWFNFEKFLWQFPMAKYHLCSGWWFQPNLKNITVVKLDHFPNVRDENKKCLKPPTSHLYSFHGFFLSCIKIQPLMPFLEYLPSRTIVDSPIMSSYGWYWVVSGQPYLDVPGS